jgi:4-carboxymuconolactone decarboxylase
MDDDRWPHPRPALRIGPVPAGERTDEAEEMLRAARESVGRTDDMHLFATLAHHPRLFTRWMPFAGTLLLRGQLPARDREVLILRTAWNCRAHYEWGHHVTLARQAGLTADDVTAVSLGPDADVEGLAAADALLLRVADELHTEATIGDTTWEALAARYGTTELVEICMLVGHYHMLAFTLNALGVQLEPTDAD